MYTTIAEFINDWTRESGLSLKIERALTDQSLSQKTDPEGRTLGSIAWHMVVMTGMTGSAAGLEVAAPPRGTEPPASAAAIADAYEMAAKSLADQASKKLTDEKLAADINIFGRTMSLASALNGLIRHQIHHRGQMTVLMRTAGVIVPGVYGPSREESAAMRAQQGR
ncbi:MAG: DinB family protein [Spirochaetia bacterium]|jgi:uncharacterized damage-inducible protein DinB